MNGNGVDRSDMIEGLSKMRRELSLSPSTVLSLPPRAFCIKIYLLIHFSTTYLAYSLSLSLSHTHIHSHIHSLHLFVSVYRSRFLFSHFGASISSSHPTFLSIFSGRVKGSNSGPSPYATHPSWFAQRLVTHNYKNTHKHPCILYMHLCFLSFIFLICSIYIAEDPEWNVPSVPSLVDTCLQSIVKNFRQYPVLDKVCVK